MNETCFACGQEWKPPFGGRLGFFTICDSCIHIWFRMIRERRDSERADLQRRWHDES